MIICNEGIGCYTMLTLSSLHIGLTNNDITSAVEYTTPTFTLSPIRTFDWFQNHRPWTS